MTGRDETQAIAVEGYAYFYPLMVMEETRRQAVNGSDGMHGPTNTLVHVRAYPDADFRVVVRPNFDTLYSVAFIDVRAEPMVVHAPALEDRFFMLPLYDMWTDAFAAPGSRTSGRDGTTFALCSPAWRGDLPNGVVRIDAPTPVVWMIGRTQTNGPSDYGKIHAFQDQMSLTPLSVWPDPAPVVAPTDDLSVNSGEPPAVVARMSGAGYFARAVALATEYGTHPTDYSQLARLERLGIRVGEPFDAAKQPPAVQDAIDGAPAAAAKLLASRMGTLGRIRNGWMVMEGVGVFGNAYIKRAIVARLGLGANPVEDATYPVLQTDADGNPLDGANDYVVHFEAGKLPPAGAFWSVTMYDADGYPVANDINRFAVGDRDDLVFNADGSLDLYLQHERPAVERVANWLPAPKGPLGVTMRIYEPRDELFSGAWAPPPVQKLG
jgi:hypothetical protein